MKCMPCFWSVRLHNKIRYQYIEDKKRLIRIKESIEAYIYIYENEFFTPTYIYFEKTVNNKEYINALKWEVQGLESDTEYVNKRIKYFYECYKATTLG